MKSGEGCFFVMPGGERIEGNMTGRSLESTEQTSIAGQAPPQ